MPTAPMARCTRCKRLHAGRGQCSPCRRASDHARGSAASRGYDHQHRAGFRPAVLARDPLCTLCHQAPSTVADHWPRSRRELVRLGLDPNDPRHGRGLCKPCHDHATSEHQPGGWNDR